MDDVQFYEYVLSLLAEAGHVITPIPLYKNHTSDEALYIDSEKDVVVNCFERRLLSLMDNVSLLADIKWPGEVDELEENIQIYSITVSFSNHCRSQNVADIHRLMQRYWSCTHSIVFFKNYEKYVISFADNYCSYILSDWRDVRMDYDDIVDRICIGNISLTTGDEYFVDFVFAAAREYYIQPISFEAASYELMPVDYSAVFFSKGDIKEAIRNNLKTFEIVYGYDYIEPKYDGIEEVIQHNSIFDEIDRISFELELDADTSDNQLGPITYEDDELEENKGDELFDDYDEEIDPTIFNDPVLMVKWLEKKQKEHDQVILENQEQERLETTKRKQKRLEAAKREQERLEVAKREQERLEAVKREQERLEAVRREQERLEAAKREQERLEAVKREQERLEAAKREQERLEAAKREQERLEAAKREQERLEVAKREQERLEAAKREQEHLETTCQDQERIKMESAHLLSQFGNTHLTKLEQFEFQYRSEKKRLTQELLQIEENIQRKNTQFSKLSFLRFLEKRAIKTELNQLEQRKQKLLMLIKDVELTYKEQCDRERIEFGMTLEKKGL